MKEKFLSKSTLIRKLCVLLIINVLSFTQLFAFNDTYQGKSEIHGVVTDQRGDLLPGVTVMVKGTFNATITGLEGEYSITVDSNAEKLIFSFLGMKTIEREILNQQTIDVVMVDDIVGLDEVVVTGYMTQKKADLTGSVFVVDKKDLANPNSSNIMKSLQGKVPGMYIQATGNPADNVSIQIRGQTSTTSTQPLLVIDGTPTNINLNDINSMDIESIQVLKDAASASIYGSRAASGVILITTKQGKKGSLSINYQVSTGLNTYIRKPDLLNTEEYGRTIWQASVNDGLDPNQQTQLFDYDWGEVSGVPVLNDMTTVEWLNADRTIRASDTNWFDLLTQTGFSQNYQLTVSHATEKASQLFSLNYFHNDGAQINTFMDRVSARINTSYDLFEGKLKIGENIALSGTNFNNQNYIYNALVMPSIAPEYAIDGLSWGGSALETGMDEHRHPTRLAKQNKDNTTEDITVIGSTYADLTLFKGFSIKSQFGLEYSARNYRHIGFSWEEEGGQGDALNSVTSYNRKSLIWTWTNTAQYSLSKDNHNLDMLIGMESYKSKNEAFSARREGIELENYDYAFLSAATENLIATGIGFEETLLSYFGKINYSLFDKYLFSITARYDGSSKFSKKHKFGFFPAASIGWRLSKEKFVQQFEFISDLKLRASWGKNGNSNISTNAIKDTYSADYASTSYHIDGADEGPMPSGYYLTHRGNSDLRWEATEQFNLGLDVSLFNQRLNGTIDVYHKITDGMLYEPDYLGTIGAGGYTWLNAANMTNDGLELAVTYNSNPNSKLYYSITGNIAANKNKIDDLPEEVIFSYGGNGLGDNILGRPLSSIYGFVADGIYQNQQEVDEGPEQDNKGIGRIKFKDLDGDGRITEEYDRTWIGIGEPDFTYGLNTYLKYDGFDLNIFLQGVVGIDVYNDYKLLSDFYNTGVIAGRNHTTRVLDAWTPTNNTSTIPALSITNINEETGRNSSYFVESGSYLKLRNVEIGYTFPTSLTKKTFIKNLRIYVSAENTLTITDRRGDNAFTGVDPEVTGNFDQAYYRPAIFKIGLNTNF